MAERRWVAVSEVMHRDVTEIDGNITVLEALKIMHDVEATSLIVKRRHEKDEYGMAKPVVWVRPEMAIRYCARLFEKFGIGHAPVINGDHKVVGIISYYGIALKSLPFLESEG